MNDNDLRVRFGLGGWKQPPLRRYQILYKSYTQAVGNWVTANCVSTEWYPNRHEGILNLRRGITAIGGGNSADYSPFYGDSMVMAVDLSATQITAVDDYAFYGCTRLSSIVLRDDTTSIGDSAFSATNLPYFSVPNGVTTIGNYAFQQSASLVTLTISSGVTSIGNYAINGCSALTNVTCLAEEPPTLGEGNTAPSGCILYVLPTALEAYQSDASWSAAFSSIQPLGNYAYITVSAGEHGSASGSGWYEIGTTVQITATPDEHYHFTAWSDGNTDNPRTITVTDDATYTASFAVDTFTLTVTGDNHTTVTGSGTYPYGTEVEITATPAEHYHFTAWSDGDTNATRTITVTSDITLSAASAIDTYTVTLTGDNHTAVTGSGTYPYGTEVNITAVSAEHYHFVAWSDGNTNVSRYITVTSDVTLSATSAINQYTLTVTGDAHTTVTGSGTYDYGTLVQITATPDEHYHFTAWNDGNMNATRTVMVADNATYTAASAINQYTITVSAGEHGSASGSGTYDYGTSVQITATANEHYHFTAWGDGNTDNPRTITVTGDATYTAAFAIDTFTVSLTGDAHTTVTGSGTYNYGTSVQISATPAEHYHFTAWSDGDTNATRTITVTSDITLSAASAINQYTITVNAGEHGTASGSGTYDYGALVQITATPDTGYGFTQWNDGNTSNPRTITVTGNATYTAAFEEEVVNVIRYTSTNEATGEWVRQCTYLVRNTYDSQTGNGVLYLRDTTTTLGYLMGTGNLPTDWSPFNNDDGLTSVDLSDSRLTTLGECAFTGCDALTTVTIGNTITSVGTINDMWGAFEDCTALQSITLPSNVTLIGMWAFKGCPNLTTVTCNATTPPTLSADNFTAVVGALYVPSASVNAYINNSSWSSKFGTINNYAKINAIAGHNGSASGSGWYEIGTTATLTATPNTGYEFTAWSDGNTSNPRTISVVGYATYTASFEEEAGVIRYTSTNQATGDWVANNTNTSRNTYDSVTGEGVLYLNNGVTTIGGGSGTAYTPFRQDTGLTSIDFSDSRLTTLGSYTCQGCTQLTSVTIGNTITTIGTASDTYGAFEGCSALTSITIPSGVTTIGKWAFATCSSLATVTCNATTPPTLASSNFGKTDDVLYVPEASIDAYYNNDTWRSAFSAVLPIGTTKAIVYEAASQATGNWVANHTNTSKNYYNSTKQVGYLYLNDDVTGIGGGGSTDNSPFYQKSDLTSVNLAFSGLTAINNYAFRASTLTTVTLPSTLTSFGNSVFRQCASLVTVKNFENTAVTTRQDKEGLFMDCTALKNITLPPALTQIGYADFRSCSALTTIDLPSTITTIVSYAFYGCSNLKTVTCRATTPPTLNSYNFNATGDTLKVPSARVSTYQNNSSWSAAFTTITSI